MDAPESTPPADSPHARHGLKAAPAAAAALRGGSRAFYWLHRLAPWIIAIILILVLWALHHELRGMRYRDILAQVRALPKPRLYGALALTALNYLVLTGYDTLAFQYIGRPLPYRAIAPVSFIGYALGNNLGMANLAGNSARYHLYSAREITPLEIARIIAFCSVTFWVSFCTTSGVFFLIEPLRIPASIPVPWHSFHMLGALLIVPAIAYYSISVWRRKPFKFRDWEFALPDRQVLFGQFVLGALDWLLAATVLYVLLPPSARLTFPTFVGVFMLSQLIGGLSHVPGGLGVFELAMLAFLGGSALPEPDLLGVLLAFRGIYYLTPLGAALLLLAGHEAVNRIRVVRGAQQVAAALGQWFRILSPHLFAAATFLAGGMMLLSGALPAVAERLRALNARLPLGVIEISHFMGSMIGVGLLVLARGLQRRLNGAYLLALWLLAAGIAASLFKGLAWEEASILFVVLLTMLPCREHFYRKSRLIDQPFTTGWVVAIAAVLGCSLWLGWFAHRRLADYSTQMWWQVSLQGNASRFLRASIGAVGVTLFVALRRLMQPARPEPKLPRPEELDRAAPIVAAMPRTYAHLALLGDKTLLWNEERTAFIMYGIEGRTWVALGDPIGPASERAELAWRFRELCDLHDGWPAFYHVTAENMPLYLDLGLSMIKLGEEAHVPLEQFTIEGRGWKSIRTTINRAVREGFTFEIVEGAVAAEWLPELRAISDAWLESKSAKEKSFSLGYFDEDYLTRSPLGLVRVQGRIVGFCNVLRSAEHEELSIDLMRYAEGAPSGVMDFLFVSLMQYGSKEGYKHFNLGMAPLSGLEERALAPIWSKLGAMLFRHGEHFYNFQGLRQYKEKFNPEWVPRYLACPGSLAVPRILANIAALIGGGVRGVVTRR